ncbi:MAG: CHAT domain-containing protein, partial [Bacteroidetes bacterium]|nr:CHAT domain-containing protein [Bacteroidota bacterium]
QEQNQGDSYFNQHNYPEAIKHYNLMLESSKKLGIYRNLPMEADVNRKIANGYEMTGDYSKAMEYVKSAMVIDSAGNNLLGIIEDHRQKGRIYIYMGLYQRSILSLEKSLKMAEGMDQSIKGVNQQAIADTYLALGQLYATMGKSESAMIHLQKSLDLFKQARDQNGEMEANLAMGSVWSDYGYFDIAKSYIGKSIEMAAGLKLGTARQNQMMASLLSTAGDYEDALRWQERAMGQARENKITGQIIWANIGMGDLYNELGDFNRAERYYKSAKAVKDSLSTVSTGLQASLDMRMGEVINAREYFTTQGSITGEAIALLRLAEIMISKNKPDSALVFLDQSQRLFSLSGNRHGIVNTQLNRGKLMADAGRFTQAKHLLDSAMSQSDFPETVWQSWFQLGIMNEKQNEPEKAKEAYLNAVSVIEKIRGKLTIDEFKSSYFRNKREVYDRLINLLLKMNRSEEAFQVSEQARSRAFYDNIAGRKINFRGALPGDLTLLEQQKRNEIEKLYKLIQKEAESVNSNDQQSRQINMREIRAALSEVQSEYEDIIQRIKLENPEYRELVSADPVQLSDLRKKIGPSTALLSYWISDNELIIWMIKNTSVSRKTVGYTKKDLTVLAEKTRKAIQSNIDKDATKGLKELFSILVSPVEEDLKGIDKLVIIPNGSLHFIPFQALINAKGEYIVNKFNITYSPSASVYALYADKQVKKGSRFMGMALGDISVGNNVGLPGTEDELKKILPLFSDKLSALGPKSTETFAKKSAGEFNFIHFATHGIYNYRQPLYSFLLFPPSDNDDGRLNVWEVFEMNINSKLVTLSACETGLGNLDQGDELVGLSRAFLYAGSSAVIVSLWSVADYPTSILMTNFYKYIKTHPLQEALTLAQRDVIKQYPQPLYWAPFILIGNGNTLAD